MKKTLSVILSFAILLAALPLGVFAAKSSISNGFTYIIKADGTAEITRYNGDEVNLVIPSFLDGIAVTSLKKGAFSGCKEIKSVEFPDTIKEIGSEMFYNCTSLEEVTIPKNVTFVCGSAFNLCSSLKEITVDTENANYKSIDGVLFDKTLTELVRFPAGKECSIYEIPYGVTTLAFDAFFGCMGLSEINVPNSVTNCSNSVFANCSSLERVTLSENMKSISDGMFKNCTALKSVIIPNGTENIGDFAFYGCTALSLVLLPNGLSEIGTKAFYNCDKLFKIHMPSSVSFIGDKAVGFTDNIFAFSHHNFILFGYEGSKAREYALKRNIRFIDEDTFCENIKYRVNKDGTVEFLNYYGDETEYEIPDIINGGLVTAVAGDAFYTCTQLEKITVPDTVTNISNHAFNNTAYYNNPDNWENGVLYVGNYLIAIKSNEVPENYVIKDGTTVIGESSFAYCNNIKAITLPTSLKHINRNAFAGCRSLESVTVPDSVSTIGDYAFMYCTALQNITLPDTLKHIGCSITLESGYELNADNWEDGVLYIGNNLICCDAVDDDYGVFRSFVPEYYEIKEGTVQIADCAFNCCPTVKVIEISEGITEIGDDTFSNCTALEEAVIPNSVKRIGADAFDGCINLKSVAIPETVTEIDYHAFGYYYAGNNDDKKVDGFTVYGYIYSEAYKYAKSNGFDFVNLGDGNDFDIKKNSIVTVEKDWGAGLIYVITTPDCKKVQEIAEQFEDSSLIFEVYRNGKSLDNTVCIRTGDSIKCFDSVTGEYIAEAHTVLYGDVNGDGSIDAFDAIEIDLICNNVLTAKNEFARAADMNGDGIINSLDYSVIRSKV